MWLLLLLLLLHCLQYNYIENIPDASISLNNTFTSLSYAGDGSNATTTSSGLCGCKVCPDMPCGLGRSGPAPGPLKTDPRQPTNGAVNARLELCGGSTGSCMTVNGQSCCLAVGTYGYTSGSPCTSGCNNYFSTISAAKPLSALWSSVTLTLPQ